MPDSRTKAESGIHLWIAMEKLGPSLFDLQNEYTKRGGFSSSDLQTLGVGMLTALERLHRLGLVHQDVKPVWSSQPVFFSGQSTSNLCNAISSAHSSLSPTWCKQEGPQVCQLVWNSGPARPARHNFQVIILSMFCLELEENQKMVQKC